MICVAKPYPRQRRISPEFAVWAFRRSGLKPSAFLFGDAVESGCLITAIVKASGSKRLGLIEASYRMFGGQYARGIWAGWDREVFHETGEQRSERGQQGVADAIAARKALTEAGITP